MSKKKITYGPLYAVEEKNIEIPSEKAGEKGMPTEQEIQQATEQQFMDIQVNNHVSELDAQGRVVRRRDENGTILTEREETQTKGEDR